MTTITIDRSVVEQALKSMDKATRFMSDSDYKKLNQAIEDLKAALAEPVQEPVSVTDLQQALVETNLIDPDAIDDPEGYDYGSTVAQIDALHEMLFKSQRPAEPVQEPVAWRYQDARGNYRYRGYVQGFDKEYSRLNPVPLYTAPPQRKENT